MSNSQIAVHVIEPAEVVLHDIIARSSTRSSANAELKALSNIESFFANDDELQQARQFTALSNAKKTIYSTRETGDFQTPPILAEEVCRFLQNQNVQPQVIIEPTFGLGNFIVAAQRNFVQAKLIYGVEIQARYNWHLKLRLLETALTGEKSASEIQVFHDDFFTHQFSDDVKNANDILILGNPPWVTNAALGFLESDNLPRKSNIKSLNGLDAMTGKSNFDLNEAILLQLMNTFGKQRGVLALLCKNSVIKNWIERLPQLTHRVLDVQALEIDAQKHFGAAVSASLLFARFGVEKQSFSCRVASLDAPQQTLRSFGWTNKRFVSDIQNYEKSAALEGVCSFVWRQGLKHDCTAVMELTRRNGVFFNARQEIVDVENEMVYPLLKSSDLRSVVVAAPRRWVLVPQKHLGRSESELKENSPRLWHYLTNNEAAMSARKSSIYKNKPPFSIFGIGDYSFKPYKVAISGFYKEPRFSLVETFENCPVMLDDTCYFLAFDNKATAVLVAFLLNSTEVANLLSSIAFTEAKRPYTKEILMRINLMSVFHKSKLSNFLDFVSLHSFAVGEEAFNSQLLNGMCAARAMQLSLSEGSDIVDSEKVRVALH